MRGTGPTHLRPHLVILVFRRVSILIVLDYSKNLLRVLCLLCARDSIVVKNLLPFLGHPGVCVLERGPCLGTMRPTLTGIVIEPDMSQMDGVVRRGDNRSFLVIVEEIWSLASR